MLPSAESFGISVENVAELKAAGYETIICNRPDGESAGQPGIVDIKRAAEAAGVRSSFGARVTSLVQSGDGRVVGVVAHAAHRRAPAPLDLRRRGAQAQLAVERATGEVDRPTRLPERQRDALAEPPARSRDQRDAIVHVPTLLPLGVTASQQPAGC